MSVDHYVQHVPNTNNDLTFRFTSEDCLGYIPLILTSILIGFVFDYILSKRQQILQEQEETSEALTISKKLHMTLFYFLVVFLSYLIMFFLMSYNFGIIVALLVGNALGFFVFGIKSSNKKSFQHKLNY